MEDLKLNKKMFILGVAAMLMVAGCGDIEDKNNREVDSEKAIGTEDNNSNGKEQEVQKEKAVGTRSNPLPFGETITVKENIYDDSSNSYESLLEITVVEMIRGEEAWEIIENENEYNEPAKEGYEYALVKVKGFLKASETEDDSLWFSTINFDFVSNEGEVYDMASAVIPNELEKELYSGGTGEGYIYSEVRIGDDYKVSYESSEGSPVFFFVK